MKTNEFTELMSFETLGEASVYKSLLEANGIKCEILNETMASILPPLSSTSTMIRLVVNHSHAELARKILDAHFNQKEYEKESSAKTI